MTDEKITAVFAGAGDFIRRELVCCGMTVYAYAIDGLVSGKYLPPHCGIPPGRKHGSAVPRRPVRYNI